MQRTVEHYDSRRNPDDVRFTKRTIFLNFPRQVDYANIYDVLTALESKRLNPRDLPSIRVVLHAGRLWTLDNSLLYIYRISPKVRRVSVVYISGQRFLQKFFHDNSVGSIERMAAAEFFPDVINPNELHSAPSPLPGRQDFLGLPAASCKAIVSSSKSQSSTPFSTSMKSVSSSSRTATSRISSEESMRMDILSPFVRSKLNPGGGKRSVSRPASSTNSSKLSTEHSVDSMMECSSALRSRMDPDNSDNFLECSVQICQARRSWSSPSTGSSRMTRRSFLGAAKGRLGRTSEGSVELEPGSASLRSKVGISPSKRVPLEDVSEEQYDQGFGGRGDDADANENDEVLEAFNLPECCYVPPKIYDPVVEEDELGEELSASRKPNVPEISLEDGLDRSVSSCSSSTERPMPRLGFRQGISGSPKRNSVSAEKALPCQVPNDDGCQISKRQLLKYMKQAFFSVY